MFSSRVVVVVVVVVALGRAACWPECLCLIYLYNRPACPTLSQLAVPQPPTPLLSAMLAVPQTPSPLPSARLAVPQALTLLLSVRLAVPQTLILLLFVRYIVQFHCYISNLWVRLN